MAASLSSGQELISIPVTQAKLGGGSAKGSGNHTLAESPDLRGERMGSAFHTSQNPPQTRCPPTIPRDTCLPDEHRRQRRLR